MIDNYFIESAKSIRYRFLELNSKLDFYSKSIEQLVSDFNRITSELQVYQLEHLPKVKTKIEAENTVKYLRDKLSEIEESYKKLDNNINPINEEMEDLQKQEQKLYKLIKEKYPSLSDEQIIRQIHENI